MVSVVEQHCFVTKFWRRMNRWSEDLFCCTLLCVYVPSVFKVKEVMFISGYIIRLGRSHLFRFNHPVEVAKMREEMKEVHRSWQLFYALISGRSTGLVRNVIVSKTISADNFFCEPFLFRMAEMIKSKWWGTSIGRGRVLRWPIPPSDRSKKEILNYYLKTSRCHDDIGYEYISTMLQLNYILYRFYLSVPWVLWPIQCLIYGNTS